MKKICLKHLSTLNDYLAAVSRYRGGQLSKSMKETSFNLKFSEIARPFVSNYLSSCSLNFWSIEAGNQIGDFFQHDLRQDGEADPFYKRQNKTKDPGVIRYRGGQLSKSMKETSFNLKFSEIARPFVSNYLSSCSLNFWSIEAGNQIGDFFQHDLRQDGEADPFYKR